MQILFVTPEVTPFARTGGLGDVSSALPKALAALGQDVRVIMPLYQAVHDGGGALSLILPDLQVPLHTGFKTARVWQGELTGQTGSAVQAPGVPIYCIEHDEYFARPGLYGSAAGDYPDNAERFSFFCRAVLALAVRLHWSPHVLHCHDWQTALLPAYLRFLPGLAPPLTQTATIYTIHNLMFQGLFPAWVLPLTGLPWSLFQPDGMEFFGSVSFMKAGLCYADYLTTVSPTYADEICTPEFGAGLDGVLRMRRSALVGILNGADYDVWNPATDAALVAPYSAADLRGKATGKRALLRTYGLPAEPPTPLLSMIARLTDQKGVDLLAAALPALFDMNLRLVILGTGEPHYQALLGSQARAHPDRLGIRFEFNDNLAHQIEAGSDAFLMPSRYEPCGLNQLYSLRYGTIPIVRATGGLRDTVAPFNTATGAGTGFVFHAATAEALLAAVQEALAVYTEQRVWHRLMQNAMAQDFSWNQSAARYLDLYRRAIAARHGLPMG
ncbi:MAG TPA: glycogen synthase GlgA [Candidatus Tectomicrobia bacterium]